MKRILSTILLIAFAIGSILAAPLKNVPCTLVQPNGEVIHCFVSGDEFFNFYHDANGYTIIMDTETGYYTYGIEQNGMVVPSSYIVGQTNPAATAALTPGARISDEIIMARRVEHARQIADNDPAPHTRYLNHGVMNNIVVFISFLNDTVFPKTFSQVDAMYNDTTSSSSVSLKNYYKHVSYNQFTIQSYLFPQAGPGDMIVSYHDNHPRSYYSPYSGQNTNGYTDDAGRREREFTLLDSAIRYVKNFIPSTMNLDYDNDGKVDNVVFIINTNVDGWSSLLWPHRWSIFDRSIYMHGKRVYDYNLILGDDETYFDIGTLCHEMFHSLGAPDLYNGMSGITYVGSWDLMEGTTDIPQNMSSYMKKTYGTWIEEIPEAAETGLYTIYPVATSQNCAYKIYPDRQHHSNQYFVVEYRNTQTPFDGSVYGTGAVIYRVNEDYNGNSGADYVNQFPEIYAFRENSNPQGGSALPTQGNMNHSYFGANNMMEFSEYTNPHMFYSNGTPITGLRITDFHDFGDSLQFYLVKGEVTIDTFPWVEPFEEPSIPYYFHQEYVNNYNNWKVHNGNNSGIIASAHSGQGNALYYSVSNGVTKLVTPMFDFTFLLNPTLSFWYGQVGGASYTMNVYYRSSPSDEWTLLEIYSTFAGPWNQATLSLPNPSATYQIAFEAAGSYGSGLVLDDIMINGTPVTDFTITASAGEHGQISPVGNVTVPVHSNQTFDLIPEQGYTVDQLLVDGVEQSRVLHYTFENVVTDHTISATFRVANPTLNVMPTALYFSSSAGEVSTPKSVTVMVNDMVEDLQVQVEAPFKVSNDMENYDLTTTVPYNGGMVYVVFAPEIGGSYSKTLTITGASLTATVNLSGTSTGIEEQRVDEVQLYPNPVGNSLNLVFAANNLPEKVEIIDVTGRVVMSVKVVDGTTSVNVENLNAGVYFVRTDNIVKKFIKK